MADESDIAVGVMRIAAMQVDGIVTFPRAKREIPGIVNLSAQNLRMSQTRPGEPMWHQLLRNIRSHYQADGNFIQRNLLVHLPRVGYQITRTGRAWLKAREA